jgi:hypothetical protein
MSESGARSQFVVGSSGTYAAVEGAVVRLADRGFPVANLAVVAHGLRPVRDSPEPAPKAATVVDSAEIGALSGVSLILVFGMFNRDDPIGPWMVLALLGFLIGALIGTGFGLLGHALSTRRRRPPSWSLAAGRYELLAADADDALRAAHLLSADRSHGDREPTAPGLTTSGADLGGRTHTAGA